MVVTQALHEIARDEFHVIELGKIENMRFRQYGSGDIQLAANINQIIQKMRIRQPFGVFVYELFADFSVRHQLCPNSHTRIIHETREKVNRFHGKKRLFSRICRA